jgi:hypothetical protein
LTECPPDTLMFQPIGRSGHASSLHNVHVNGDSLPDGHLSDVEFRHFTALLHRFCQHELDQWENWRCRTTYGWVYINISRELPDGHREDAYEDIPHAE